MRDNAEYAALERLLLDHLDEDDATTMMQVIPDGWAKVDGRWVRLEQVGWFDPVMGLCCEPIDAEGCPLFKVVEVAHSDGIAP